MCKLLCRKCYLEIKTAVDDSTGMLRAVAWCPSGKHFSAQEIIPDGMVDDMKRRGINPVEEAKRRALNRIKIEMDEWKAKLLPKLGSRKYDK